MKEELSNKERAIKEILSDHQWDIDSLEIWDSIKTDVQKKDDDKSFFIWWVFAGMLFLFIVYTLIDYGGNDKVDVNTNSATRAVVESENHISYNDQEFQAMVNPEMNKSESNNPIKDKPVAQNINAFEPSNRQKVLTDQHQKSRNQTSKLTEDIRSMQEYFQEPSNIRKAAYETEQSSGAEDQVIDSQYLDYISPLRRRTSYLNQKLQSKLWDQKISLTHKRGPSFFIIAQAGTSIARWQYSEIFNGDDNHLGKPASSGTLGIGYHMSDKTYFHTSFNLTTSIDYYQDQYKDVITTDVSAPSSIYIDSEGNQSYSAQSAKRTTKVNRDVLWHSYHHQFFVDATIGHELWRHRRWSVKSELGLGYNVHTISKGYYPEPSELHDIVKYEKGGDHPYVRSGLSLKLALRAGYDINNLTLMGSIGYRMQPNSITNENYPLKIKSSQIGLEFGIFYSPRWE